MPAWASKKMEKNGVLIQLQSHSQAPGGQFPADDALQRDDRPAVPVTPVISAGDALRQLFRVELAVLSPGRSGLVTSR
jgi:hypothetical protein